MQVSRIAALAVVIGAAALAGARTEPEAVDAAAPALRHAILDGGTKPAAHSPADQIQLGAFRDQATARGGWNQIVAASDGMLQGMSPLLVPADLPGKGRLWRLRAAVGDKSSARKLLRYAGRQRAGLHGGQALTAGDGIAADGRTDLGAFQSVLTVNL